MYNKLLLPNKFKNWGWLILIIGIILIVLRGFEILPFDSSELRIFALINSNLGNGMEFFKTIPIEDPFFSIAGVLFIVGGILVGYSKEKTEDEFIANLRLTSLLWAVLANYILLFLSFTFVWGMAFFDVMVYNMITVLAIFIIRFNFILYKNNRLLENEK
jgi:hypothetical protein